MKRRHFLKLSFMSITSLGSMSLMSCGRQESDESIEANPRASQARSRKALADGERVLWYDTYAMALYMDGGLGPKTGIIKAEYLLKNEPITMKFWHGHGGKDHAFTLLPEHFSALKAHKKILIKTTEVDGHTHNLFVDPNDPKWRVPGAVPVEIPGTSLYLF